MKTKSKRNRRATRRQSRQLNLESLESREMLTSVAADYFAPPPGSPAIAIRTDAVAQEHSLHSNSFGWKFDNQLEKIISITQPDIGSVEIADGGITVLITAAQLEGQSSFSYTYESTLGETETGTAYLNFVSPVTAVDDWVRIIDSSGNLAVGENDQVFNSNNGVTITAVGETSSGGSVSISEDGQSVNYSAADNFIGLDTFTYTVEDELGATDTATVTVDVNPNSKPDYFASEEEFETYIRDGLLKSHAGRFGQSAPLRDWYYYPRRGFSDGDIFLDFALADSSSDASVANSTSETNVQVQGVDEGDLVKTDGNFLYQLSNRTEESERLHELVVMDIRNADMPSVVRRLSFDGPLIEQYLIDDRLTVIWSAETQEHSDWFWGFNANYATGSTMVSVFDISDPTALQLVEETKIDGSHFQSRAVDGTIYVLTSANLQPNAPLEKNCADNDSNNACFYETTNEFLARIDTQVSELAMPSFVATDENGNTNEGKLVDYSELQISVVDSHWNLTNVVSFDVDGDVVGPEASSAYVTTGATELYVSTSAIYLAERTSVYDSLGNWTQDTDISKLEFDQDGHGVTLTATGSIPGWLENSFSMDEHEGFLRITAMLNWQGGANLYVLEHTDSSLDIVGQIDNMAPGEQIYATRFMGDRGYVVTFRRVDPLFTIDLSDPTNPVVTGELKVPGFSNYLQPIGENHLIGIGRNADESSGMYDELQVSLFNVSDLDNPTLVDRYSFEGGRSLWTPVAPDARSMGDHHAVTYLPQHGVLALPIYSEPSWFGWGWDVVLEDGTAIQNGIRMLDIDLENGITEIGNIDFEDRASRSVRVGDYLYGISSSTVKVVQLDNPQQVVSELYVGLGATDDHVATREQGPVIIDVLENDNFKGDSAELSITTTPKIGSAKLSEDGKSIVYDPPEDFFGKVTMEYDVAGETPGRTSAMVELVYQWGWHNDLENTDINDDGSTSTNDVLVLFNLLNDGVMGDVEDLERQDLKRSPVGKHRPDANNDGRLNISDALKVVNLINAKQKAAANLLTAANERLTREAQGESLVEQSETQYQMPVTDPKPVDPKAIDLAIEDLTLELDTGEKINSEKLNSDLLDAFE
jgi:uncharacterized secreted protein with C-terminal beta-propeller domain